MPGLFIDESFPEECGHEECGIFGGFLMIHNARGLQQWMVYSPHGLLSGVQWTPKIVVSGSTLI